MAHEGGATVTSSTPPMREKDPPVGLRVGNMLANALIGEAKASVGGGNHVGWVIDGGAGSGRLVTRRIFSNPRQGLY